MKKKGFTLVELLAVIVILAIIALITIPLVIKTINNSQKESEKQSIAGYARAIEDDIANYMMINPGNKYENYTPTKDFDYKGNKVFCFSRTVSSTGKLTLNNCYVSDKELTSEEIKEKKIHLYKYENGKVDPVGNNQNNSSSNNSEQTSSYTAYSVGDTFSIYGDSYHIIADSGTNQDYVVALKDEPLTVEEINANKIGSDGINHVNRYSGSGSVGVAYDYVGDGSVGGVAYYSSENCGYINGSGIYDGCTTSYDDSDIKHVVDKYASTTFYSNELKTIGDYKARLPEKEELRQIGWIHCASTATWCTEESSTPSWLYNWEYGYWTMSGLDNSSEFVWSVDHHGGYLVHYSVGSEIGIRPVINIYKSAIPSQ